jgi:hypothetical protein
VFFDRLFCLKKVIKKPSFLWLKFGFVFNIFDMRYHMSEFRIACFSEPKILAKYGKKKLSASLVQKAVKDRFLFDIQDTYTRQYCSPDELRKEGFSEFILRYNRDLNLAQIKL